MDLIVGGINSLFLIIAVSLYALTIIQSRPLPNDQEELELLKVEAKSRIFHDTYTMDAQTINLPTKNSKLRYLEIQIHLHPFKREQLETLKTYNHILNDVLIEQASRIQPDELSSAVGRILLEERVKRGINDRLENDVVKRLFFSKFVIQ